MGHRELIASLHEKGEALIRQMWKEADGKADGVRADASSRITELRASTGARRKREISRLTDDAVAEARTEEKRIRLEAHDRLARRLYDIARSILGDFRNGPESFARLAAEAPPGTWTSMRVNGEDREAAARMFPGADIICAADVSGGLELISDDGTVRFDNTFEKRLETAWPGLLSEMMRDGEIGGWKF